MYNAFGNISLDLRQLFKRLCKAGVQLLNIYNWNFGAKIFGIQYSWCLSSKIKNTSLDNYLSLRTFDNFQNLLVLYTNVQQKSTTYNVIFQYFYIQHSLERRHRSWSSWKSCHANNFFSRKLMIDPCGNWLEETLATVREEIACSISKIHLITCRVLAYLVD